MARFIALDADRLEARIIVARDQGNKVAVDQVVSVPLSVDENDGPAIERGLREALGSVRVSKSQVMTAVGRAATELRTLKLPPAPEEELPDMVRFQALREFSSLKEESPLDFLPLGAAAQEAGEVMAAAIPQDLFEHIENAVTSQGHELVRCTLRPCSAASLAMRLLPRAESGITLIIAQQADSAELAITKDGVVVFTRSFRLPSGWHPGETGEPLLGEVRRTIVAARNQLGGSNVDHVVMFGTEAEHSGLCERLKERTQLDVEIVDPFSDVKVSGSRPEQPERFAALLGMLHDEVSETRPAIDFKNPRKAPEPESNTRQHVLYAATGATVLLGVLFLAFWQHRSLNNDISHLKGQIRKLSRDTKKLQPATALAGKLNDWKKGDRNWLDELYHLSDSSKLNADDFRIESITARTQQNLQGVIEVRARAKDEDALQAFQSVFNDKDHTIVPLTANRDAREDKRYPERFTTKIQIARSIPVVQLPSLAQPNEPPDSQDEGDGSQNAEPTAETADVPAKQDAAEDAAEETPAEDAAEETPAEEDAEGEQPADAETNKNEKEG